jgi:hypothetical protein
MVQRHETLNGRNFFDCAGSCLLEASVFRASGIRMFDVGDIGQIWREIDRPHSGGAQGKLSIPAQIIGHDPQF